MSDDNAQSLRDTIYEKLHEPVINALVRLSLISQAALIDPDSTPDSLRITLAKVQGDTRQIIREIRRIVAPSYLDPAIISGMISSSDPRTEFIGDLRAMIADHATAYGFKAMTDLPEPHLSLLAIQQYLPIQDLLGNWLDNAGRHAKAKNVHIVLSADDDRRPSTLTLMITNDGKGDERLTDLRALAQGLPPDRRGIRAILDAIDRLNGEHRCISSNIGGSTLVVAKIPVSTKHVSPNS